PPGRSGAAGAVPAVRQQLLLGLAEHRHALQLIVGPLDEALRKPRVVRRDLASRRVVVARDRARPPADDAASVGPLDELEREVEARHRRRLDLEATDTEAARCGRGGLLGDVEVAEVRERVAGDAGA